MTAKNQANYWQLFKYTFLISAFTFGGGYVIVPLLKQRFVDQLDWMEEGDMMNLIAIAQSAPGALAINASVLIGHQLKGLTGALVACVGTALPPLIIMTIVSYIYDFIRNHVIIQNIMMGMQAGIAAIIFSVVWDLAKPIFESKNKRLILVMAISIILSIFLKLNVIYILLFAAIIALLSYAMNRKEI